MYRPFDDMFTRKVFLSFVWLRGPRGFISLIRDGLCGKIMIKVTNYSNGFLIISHLFQIIQVILILDEDNTLKPKYSCERRFYFLKEKVTKPHLSLSGKVIAPSV